MSDCMTFPDTVEEFMENYKVVDTDGIYMSKGAELVPIFRMRQWFEHLPYAQPEIIHCCDCKHRGEKPIADGRYWCEIHDTFMYYCSDAERRTDEMQ